MIPAAFCIVVLATAIPRVTIPSPESITVLRWARAASQDVPDVFAARFRSAVRRFVAAATMNRTQRVREYVLDEGDRWSVKDGPSLLERFLALPQDTPGRQRAEAFLEEQGDPDATLTDREKERFAELVAREYFGAWAEAIRRAAPRSRFLGGRFASPPPAAVRKGMSAALRPQNRAAGR